MHKTRALNIIQGIFAELESNGQLASKMNMKLMGVISDCIVEEDFLKKQNDK